MAQPAAEVRRWTREEYEQLAEAGFLRPNERVELIDGIIYEMSPQNSLHATALLNALEELRAAFSDGYHVRPQLPLALDSQSQPEPDLAVVSGRPQEYRTAHPATAVLVLEISDSSLRLDREVKRGLYAEAGIPEYWVLSVGTRQLEVFREPEGGEYRSRIALGPDETVTPLAAPAALIRIADLLP
jgi:Uma2 family endonuclease